MKLPKSGVRIPLDGANFRYQLAPKRNACKYVLGEQKTAAILALTIYAIAQFQQGNTSGNDFDRQICASKSRCHALAYLYA